MTPYLQMALNNAWANATFYQALAGLPEGGFQAKGPGFFGSLQATMNHIYEVDLYYIDALVAGGRGRSVYNREEVADPAELGRLQAESDARLAQFCRDLTPEILALDRQTERKDGMTTERVEWLLPHLFQHQVHHRGQAHVQLQEAGVAPPQLDDFFLEHGRVPSAAAYWSDALRPKGA